MSIKRVVLSAVFIFSVIGIVGYKTMNQAKSDSFSKLNKISGKITTSVAAKIVEIENDGRFRTIKGVVFNRSLTKSLISIDWHLPSSIRIIEGNIHSSVLADPNSTGESIIKIEILDATTNETIVLSTKSDTASLAESASAYYLTYPELTLEKAVSNEEKDKRGEDNVKSLRQNGIRL